MLTIIEEINFQWQIVALIVSTILLLTHVHSSFGEMMLFGYLLW